MKKIKLAIVIIMAYTASISSQNDVTLNDATKVFDANNIENYVFGTDIEDFSIKIDENKDLVFTKIVQNIKITKDEIYNRALSFYIRTYKDAKSVLQQQDKEAGIIIGKGLFSDFYISKGTFKYLGNKNTVSDYYSAYHIMRIDIKDGRARIIVTVNSYDIKPIFVTSSIVASVPNEQPTVNKRIVDCQPIDTTSINDRIEWEVSKHSSYKNTYKKYYSSYMPIILESEKSALAPLCKIVSSTIENLEKVLKEESSNNNENW